MGNDNYYWTWMENAPSDFDTKLFLEFDINDRYGEKYINKNPFLGLKGTTYLEAGYVYAPYIPMVIQEQFSPKKSIMSRYSEKTINKDFYGEMNHVVKDFNDDVKQIAKYYTGNTFVDYFSLIFLILFLILTAPS